MSVMHTKMLSPSQAPHHASDDFDLSTLLACPPSMPYLGRLTPHSINRIQHSSSVSSDSTSFTGDSDMPFPQHDDDVAQRFYYLDPPTSYYPASVSSEPETMSYGVSDIYSNYEHQQWLGLPLYSQPPILPSFTDAPPSAIFPSFDAASSSSRARVIPPTPQDVAPISFNFGNPLQTDDAYLEASPAFSYAASSRPSQEGSVSSQSRSCSPNPSMTRSASTRAALSSLHRSSSNTSLHAYGIPVNPPGASPGTQTWRCAYPGCTSRALFTRGCDLRKHFNRHSKHLFCRVEGCPQSAPQDLGEGRGSISASGGFSSKKDRARHEAKHNPGIRCEWQGPEGEECGRVFSRMDNMKDHVRRIHRKGGR